MARRHTTRLIEMGTKPVVGKPMQLTLNEVNELFIKLIEADISREDADRWAYAKMQAFDANELEFYPCSDEVKLWNAVQYLYGIVTKVSPNEYMHSLDEIKDKFEAEWQLPA